MPNSLGLSQLLQQHLPKAQAWTGGSGWWGHKGPNSSAVTEMLWVCLTALPSTLLTACSSTRISNFQNGSSRAHWGFFPFFIKAVFFFLKKKVSSSDFIAALLKQYTKNKKRQSIQISGFFQTSGLFIFLKNTLFSPPMKTAVYFLLTKYRCKVTEFRITNKFK